MKGQGSYEAIIGTMVCVFLFMVAISYLSIDTQLVSESYERVRLSDLAIVLSNDLLLNPGYGEVESRHFGLALYDKDKNAVEDHFLDIEKLKRLDDSGLCELVKGQWSIENDFFVRVEKVDEPGGWGECEKKEGDVYSVTRLGMIKERGETKVVRLVFELYG